MTGADLCNMLERELMRPRASEAELQRAIAEALVKHKIDYVAEAPLGERSRVDFLVSGGIALEAKVSGALTDVISQLMRYAVTDSVTELVVATTCYRHAAIPSVLAGRQVHVARLYIAAAL